MKLRDQGQQGRGGGLPGWAIEMIQIAVAILITAAAYFLLAQYGAG